MRQVKEVIAEVEEEPAYKDGDGDESDAELAAAKKSGMVLGLNLGLGGASGAKGSTSSLGSGGTGRSKSPEGKSQLTEDNLQRHNRVLQEYSVEE